ncbi:site-specific recombinase, phage integrase family [Leptospira ryugenii]|uniref:Site-specific recombinase, phage integrase family n=1 Tax=Leptospira ryugenii TaxID=1917863 RepID=A0A2P2DXS4_9LEPT|nr:tyrosine-type recombinase/integrase [Leptospira ryugenii]GBF49416.1 site-specific recombinase, phage integrase family [Leptospira ryugenii]
MNRSISHNKIKFNLLNKRDKNRVLFFFKTTNCKKIDPETLVNYLLERRRLGISTKTLKADKFALLLAVKLSTVGNPKFEGFVEYLHKVIKDSIKMKIPNNRLRESDLLTVSEMERIVKHATDRQRVLCRFLWATGIRPGEITRIKLKDCAPLDGDIEIKINGKQERIRFILIPKLLFEEIRSTYEGKTHLFESVTGDPLSVNAIEKMVNKLSKNLLKRRIYPYLFRHTFATNQIKDGNDIGAVSEFMGNSPDILARTYLHSNLSKDAIMKNFGKIA